MLVLNPAKRITAAEALRQPWISVCLALLVMEWKEILQKFLRYWS